MLFALDSELIFPPVHLAEPDGLLAMGGDLSPARLLLAYKSGIFPWYEGDTILWWSPDPRFVLLPGELKISKTIRALRKKNSFTCTVNQAFASVIHHCKSTKRPGQMGTWITSEVEIAFNRMHELGYAHSVEVWQQDRLVGGLYGIRVGHAFFGESMFSLLPNASRFAFSFYAEKLFAEDTRIIDCQVYTPYLESFGARMIPRETFLKAIED